MQGEGERAVVEKMENGTDADCRAEHCAVVCAEGFAEKMALMQKSVKKLCSPVRGDLSIAQDGLFCPVAPAERPVIAQFTGRSAGVTGIERLPQSYKQVAPLELQTRRRNRDGEKYADAEIFAEMKMAVMQIDLQKPLQK